MVSVCSTTLWLGQLDKKTQQQDVTSLMEEFGQIESINMIPPRGCAYIVMVHRQDAYTALNKLSRGNSKINHKSFKIAWAMNKGVGGRFKKYWNMELGVTYVPWQKLKDTEVVALQEGAVLDQETLKPEWASLLAELKPVKPIGDCGEGPKGESEGGASIESQVKGLNGVSDQTFFFSHSFLLEVKCLPTCHTCVRAHPFCSEMSLCVTRHVFALLKLLVRCMASLRRQV